MLTQESLAKWWNAILTKHMFDLTVLTPVTIQPMQYISIHWLIIATAPQQQSISHVQMETHWLSKISRTISPHALFLNLFQCTLTDPSFLVTRLQVFEDVNVLMSPLPCCLSDSSSLSQYLITMPNDTSDTFVLDLTSVTWGSQIDVDTKIAISDGLGFATSFSVYHLDDDPVTATEYAPDLCDIGQTVNCLVAPCEVSSGCQMHPNAVCVNDYCGGCTAKWYDKMLVQTLDNDLMEDVTDSCDAGCICPAVFDPVYCEDGETYSNSCDAGCNGMTQCTKKMPIPPLVIDRKKVIEHKKKMRIQTFKHLRSRWRNVDKRSKHAAVAV
eukprot:136386_1